MTAAKLTVMVLLGLALMSVAVIYGFPVTALDLVAQVQRASAGVAYREQVLPSGVRMAYLDSDPLASAEKPVVVMLHGITSNKDIWLRLLVRYPDYRVIAVDLPGHGDTTEPEDFDFRVENMSQQVGHLVDALALPPFHLVGNSLGGLIGGLYSVAQPDQVVSLTLMNTAGIDAPMKSDFMQSALSDRRFNPLLVTKPEDFDVMMSAVVARPPTLPFPVRQMAIAQLLSRVEENSRVFQAVTADPDNMTKLEPVLPRLQAPALLLWGERDRVFHVSTVERALSLAPGLETHVIKDCGHLPMVEAPTKTAAILRAFFASTAAVVDAVPVQG